MTTEEFIRDIIPLQPAMQRMAEHLLHDSDNAADAVQETLTSLWHKRVRLSFIKDKRSYCLSALHNECLSMLRRQRPSIDIQTLADTLPDTPVQAALDAEQRFRQLDQAVAELSPIQQQIIRLKYVEQLSTKEISQQTGLSPSNIDTIMSRTYALLRKKIK